MVKHTVLESDWKTTNLLHIYHISSKGDWSWVFFGRNDAKAETPALWPPHANSWLIRKDSDAGRVCGQEQKGMTEDEMAGWHHWLNGRESEWTLGVGDAQGGLACCDSWGHKESDTTEWLNWTELKHLTYMKWIIFQENIKWQNCHRMKISLKFYKSIYFNEIELNYKPPKFQILEAPK